MPNRRLTAPGLQLANELLARIRDNLELLSAGDPELLFAYRRKVFKELTYDERDKPMFRRKLKSVKRKEQGGFVRFAMRSCRRNTAFSIGFTPRLAIRLRTPDLFANPAT
jgi:hypothetical protein